MIRRQTAREWLKTISLLAERLEDRCAIGGASSESQQVLENIDQLQREPEERPVDACYGTYESLPLPDDLFDGLKQLLIELRRERQRSRIPELLWPETNLLQHQGFFPVADDTEAGLLAHVLSRQLVRLARYIEEGNAAYPDRPTALVAQTAHRLFDEGILAPLHLYVDQELKRLKAWQMLVYLRRDVVPSHVRRRVQREAVVAMTEHALRQCQRGDELLQDPFRPPVSRVVS